jgi:lipoate-protein ligase A
MLNKVALNNFRLIVTGAKSGVKNIAIDKALLDNYDIKDMPILRVYSWRKSCTVGVSHSQPLDKNTTKRFTGGGIIMHGNDISYSLFVPKAFFKQLDVKQSYEHICKFLFQFYSTLGLNVAYAKDIKNIKLSSNKFCQKGFEPYDILCDGKKLGGNAQKRTKDTVFQHGSIPIKKYHNIKKNIGYTLQDCGIFMTKKEGKKILIDTFSKTFNINLVNSKLTKSEKKVYKKILNG